MKKLLSISLLTILLLSACGNEPEQPEEENQAPLDTADQLLDQQLFADALRDRDESICADIENESLQGECTELITSLELTDEAMLKKDDKFCGDIPLERYEENCEKSVARMLEQEKEAENYEAEVQAQITRTEEIIASNRPSDCTQLEDEVFQNQCRNQIYLNRASQNDDRAACDEIEEEEVKNICLSFFRENADVAPSN